MAKDSTENKNDEYVPNVATLKQSICNPNKNVTLKIKEEQLDISKEWMQTGDVKIYRESSTLQKSFTVPVERVELVIEHTIPAGITTKHNDMHTEVIRIPLSEESIEFTKHKVTLEDVSIYKQKIQDIKIIEATLKREEAKVKVSGSLRIKD